VGHYAIEINLAAKKYVADALFLNGSSASCRFYYLRDARSASAVLLSYVVRPSVRDVDVPWAYGLD